MAKMCDIIIRDMNIETKLHNLVLKNPVVLASGTFDKSIINLIDINKLGGVVTKTITLQPREGNPLPHIVKTKYGFLNSVGLKNVGIKKYISDELPFWQKFNTVVITSIGGETIEEYIKLAKILNTQNIDALEVNISCPNVAHGGMSFGTNPKIIKKLVTGVRKNFSKTLIVKLTPNVTDIKETAKVAIVSGADVLSIANTFLGLEIDNKKKKSILHRITGGYSGPAIKPMALRAVYEVYKDQKCSIIGGGGITDFSDALDYVMCGASAVSIGSGMYFDRKLPEKIVTGFEKYFRDNNIDNINKIKGLI